MRSIATFPLGLGSASNRLAAALGAAILVGAAAIPASGQLVEPVVRSVNFSGNHNVDPDLLAASIATTESTYFARVWWLRWLGLGQKRTFNQAEFATDVYRLQIIFKRSGYPDVKVDTVVKRSPGAVNVTFKITEGTPNRLASLNILGLDSVDNAWRYRQDLPIITGDVASDLKLHETADTITMRLRNHGYPDAIVVVDESGGADKTNAILQVHTGPYARFGPITVTAPAGVDTAFVSSLVPARPGSEYRWRDLLQSQRALYVSDLFRSAAVGIDSTRFTLPDSVVPLAVSVLPNFGHRVKASAGYGTDDCFRVGTGWTSRNFPGTGLVLDVTGQLSKIGVGSPLGFGLEHNLCGSLLNDSIGSRVANYGLNASLRRNAFLSASNALTFSVFATRHSEFEVYRRQEVGTSISLTRVTAIDVPITLTYRIADGTTTADPASFCAFFNTCDARDISQLQQRQVQGTLSLSAVRQRLNNPVDPLRGSILSASVTTSARWLGSSSTQQFTRLVGDASGFLPLTRNIVLAGHVRGGIIVSPRVSIDSAAGNFVPPDQRFYAGGAYDVRGYDQNELGPLVYVVPTDSITPSGTFPQTAVRVAPVGGTRVGIGNLELRLPTPFFAGRLRVAVFVDAGALWNETGPSPLRVTPGAGLRYSSPLGPIRLDFGYNKYPLEAGPIYSISTDGSLTLLQNGFVKASTSKWTLHFSIGQAF
ncbi:MAG TPA: BamA/TamA family outer membrane protein [Gemmatimonadales bacterium]|jgi:outer membrane protein insertion porin family/translocation and assembly module TamA